MKYKAIFCDFDGTLCQKPPVSDKNINAINDYVKHGGKFFLSTGRIYKSAYPLLKETGIQSEMMIVSQGAEIYDLVHDEYISRFLMPIETVKAVSDYIESLKDNYSDFESLMYIDGYCYFSNRSPEKVKMFCDILKVEPHYIDCSIYDYVKKIGKCPTKILTIMENQDLKRFLIEANDVIGDKTFISESRDFLVEIMPIEVNKGKAVKKVCEMYGIMLDDVICIGDSGNDIPMIKVAGLGIAVANAYDDVKKAAKYIAVDCEEDAIADVIYKFCLGDKND